MNMGRPRGRSKKPKCIVPKCKNTPSRMTPEGEPVCRTHLARRNMFGAVDAESPTIPSVGKRNLQYKNGFNVVSATQERQSGYIEDSVNLKTKFKNKRIRDMRKRFFQGKNSYMDSYKDFARDGGLDNE
tara:strand:- start:1041 stop:1427 length:387 start_codon:yes stop_codon:yes gene_type:complete